MTESLQGHYAGFVSRLLAYAIDVAIVTLTLLMGAWFLNAAASMFEFVNVANPSVLLVAISGLVTSFYVAGYYVFFWTLTGQTPGKFLLGVRVVTLDGRPLSVWRSVRRFIGYILSAMALWIGFLWILVDNRRQGWHDKFAGTCVIYTWEARPGAYYVAHIQDQPEPQQRSE